MSQSPSGLRVREAEGPTEADPQQGTAAGGVACLGVAATRFGRLAHDREAKARPGKPARAAGAIETVEYEREIGLVEARAAAQ